MGEWDVFVKMKVPIRDVSASGKCSPVFFSGVSASEKINNAAPRSFSIGEMNSTAQRSFSIMKK